jgi:hypothetical protein
MRKNSNPFPSLDEHPQARVQRALPPLPPLTRTTDCTPKKNAAEEKLHVSCWSSMASSSNKRGSRKGGGPFPTTARPAFSRAPPHPSSALPNFQGFGGGSVEFASYSPAIGGGDAGWIPGLGPSGFDGMPTGSDGVGLMTERGDSFDQIIAYLQIMTPVGPEPLCCIYISSIHISLHQLRLEISAQLPSAHLPASWNFAKLSANEGAMFVPLQQERSMSMSLYISPAGALIKILFP